MMLRTHLAVIFLFILLFLPHIGSKAIFIIVALIATLIPDVDTGYSTIGKMKGFRFLQFFVRHRGMIHSLTFAIVLSVLIAFFYPLIALPFFLGYSVHIFFDSFTIEGVMPFWPYRKTSRWHFKTGSLTETSIFIVFLLIDLFVLVVYFKNIIV